jgi:hypothetical protein
MAALSHFGIDWKLLALLGVLVGGLAIANVEVAPPDGMQGQLEVTSAVRSCEFASLGKNSGRFFVGVRLRAEEAPLIRANPKHAERPAWEALCARKPSLLIRYHAKKRLLGPVRFWLDSYVER